MLIGSYSWKERLLLTSCLKRYVLDIVWTSHPHMKTPAHTLNNIQSNFKSPQCKLHWNYCTWWLSNSSLILHQWDINAALIKIWTVDWRTTCNMNKVTSTDDPKENCHPILRLHSASYTEHFSIFQQFVLVFQPTDSTLINLISSSHRKLFSARKL